MKIYHVYDSYDSAATDMFYPTKREAMQAVKEIEAYAKQRKQNESTRLECHKAMYEELELLATSPVSICNALKYWPQR